MALLTTEEQIQVMKQKLLEPGISDVRVREIEKIIKVLEEED